MPHSPPLVGVPRLRGGVHAPPQEARLGADPWVWPPPQWQPPDSAPPPQYHPPAPPTLPQCQPATPPSPQPPQGDAGGVGPLTSLFALGLSDTTLQEFAAVLQGVVTAGVVSALPYPSPAAPWGKVAQLSLLHLLFACGVVVDSDIPPIYEVVDQRRGKTEGLATLNQALMGSLPYCQQRVLGGDKEGPTPRQLSPRPAGPPQIPVGWHPTILVQIGLSGALPPP